MNARLVVRRTVTAVALAAATVAAMTVAAGPALAQPSAEPPPPSQNQTQTQTQTQAPSRPDARDRVVRAFAGNLVLEPERSASGAGIRAVARVGAADATPDRQVWRSERARQGRGAINLVHAPSVRGQGARPLCLDVDGDSRAAGARLVLRPCDGTESQAWRQLSTVPPSSFQNLESGLVMEVAGGRLIQAGFPARDDADRRARTNAQLFFNEPKSFGVGGA